MDIKHFLQNLFTKSKAFDPASRQFLSVDRNYLEKELDLKKRAEEDGKNNIPKPDATAKDTIASDIDACVGAIVRRGKDELQDHFQAIGALDTTQSVSTQITELKTNTLEVLNKLYKTCKNGVNELYSIKRDVADGELAYEKFRSENDLNRPGDYPENRVREFSWIILILVIEALFNSWALGTAHPEGPLGVFLDTVGIAALNVLFFGFAIGWSWRQTHHVSKIKVFFSYLSVIFFAFLVLVFNFIVGHYRDSLMGLQTKALDADIASFYTAYENLFRTAVEKAFSDAFWAFGDIKSFLLIFVGIAMSVFAARKAFKLDDPYPGYGSVCRAQNKRNTDYADLFSEIQEELEEIGNGVNSKIAGIFEMSQAFQDTIKDHEETLDALTSKYQSWISELNAVGVAMYATYRQVNEQHRTEGSPPAFQLDFSIPDDMAIPPARPKPVKDQEIGHLRDLKDACLTIVNTAINKYLGIYKTISALAPENVKANRVSIYDIEVEKINTELQKQAQTSGISDKQA